MSYTLPRFSGFIFLVRSTVFCWSRVASAMTTRKITSSVIVLPSELWGSFAVPALKKKKLTITVRLSSSNAQLRRSSARCITSSSSPSQPWKAVFDLRYWYSPRPSSTAAQAAIAQGDAAPSRWANAAPKAVWSSQKYPATPDRPPSTPPIRLATTKIPKNLGNAF